MVRTGTPLPEGNRLLDSLAENDRRRLAEEVEVVRLKLMETLYGAGESIDSVYFPLQSVVSVLTRAQGTSGVEVATIGNEGLVGLSRSWGAAELNPAEFLQVQVPGPALRMPAEAFGAELARGSGLADVVRRYTQAFVSQLMQQVACNGLHSIEERCARWMLLTHDRVGCRRVPTYPGISRADARRPTCLGNIRRRIAPASRLYSLPPRRVTVTNREGLENTACECYSVLQEVFERLVP